VDPSRVQSHFFSRGGLSRARSLPTAPLAVAAAVVVAVVVAVAAAAIASTMATAAVAAAERSPRARRLVVGGRGGSAAAVAAERRPGVERDTRPAWSHFASVVSAGRLIWQFTELQLRKHLCSIVGDEVVRNYNKQAQTRQTDRQDRTKIMIIGSNVLLTMEVTTCLRAVSCFRYRPCLLAPLAERSFIAFNKSTTFRCTSRSSSFDGALLGAAGSSSSSSFSTPVLQLAQPKQSVCAKPPTAAVFAQLGQAALLGASSFEPAAALPSPYTAISRSGGGVGFGVGATSRSVAADISPKPRGGVYSRAAARGRR
jgi:hypothetical protein